MIIQTDLKNITRDPSLWVILFVPAIMLALLYFGYPFLLEVWPAVTEYTAMGLAMFCITASLMPGIALAFVILDEKDQNLHAVLQVLPVSYKRITINRLVMIFVLGFFSALLLLSFSGIKTGNYFQIVLLSIACASTAPLLAMIPAFYASNKIEGATFTKLLNFLIMLPIASFFVPWNKVFAVLPTWWIYYAFENIHAGSRFVTAVTIALVYHSLLLFFFFRYAMKSMVN